KLLCLTTHIYRIKQYYLFDLIKNYKDSGKAPIYSCRHQTITTRRERLTKQKNNNFTSQCIRHHGNDSQNEAEKIKTNNNNNRISANYKGPLEAVALFYCLLFMQISA